MENSQNVHNDPELAKSIYPSGDKTQADALCICGGVRITIKTDMPLTSAFCHCRSCKRAHSSPIYHAIYCSSANIDPRNGHRKEGEFQVMINEGFDLLKPVPGGPGNPNYRSWDESPRVGGMGRMFCKKCGVIMLNAFFKKVGDGGDSIGVFPGTFTKPLSSFVESWQPTCHQHCEHSELTVSAIHDGLIKFKGWREEERLFG